ncbi:MAG: sulfotransferase domain-containing protein [Planctomycetota bacterium]
MSESPDASRLLPDFLIIGAMKAGTTTIFQDLRLHSRVFIPEDKEPHTLIHHDVFSPEGRQVYESLYRRAAPDSVKGDASTGYAKRPFYEGVSSRAKRLMGDRLRIIYAVRDPIARIVSHHHHLVTYNRAPASIDEAVRSDPDYVNFSRYAYQLEPWLRDFGPERVLTVDFHRYTRERQAGAEAIWRFLGLSPPPRRVDAQAVYNRSGREGVALGRWASISQSTVYRKFVRPLLSDTVRESMMRRVLPQAAPRPRPPRPETVRWLLDELTDDMEAWARSEAAPVSWSRDELQARWMHHTDTDQAEHEPH